MEYMEIGINKLKDMNKENAIYKKVILAALLLSALICQYGNAQEKLNTPLSIELQKARSTWFNTGNGAGLSLDNLDNFGSLDASYSIAKGDFKRVQQGDRENMLGLNAEGGRRLGDAYAWGKFSYNNESVTDSRFNTAMLDPFRPMPFYPVDPNVSDWKKQSYDLSMKVSSKPLLDRYLLGLQASYIARTGAKQVDPRSEPYQYAINVKPGIVALVGKHQFGANFEYENMKQEARHTNSNDQVNQNVFVMKGLGNHYPAVIGGTGALVGFLYTSNKVGGELQYSLQLSPLRLFVNGGYTYRVENVIRDVTKPRKEGAVKENIFYANVAMLHEGENLNRVDLSVSSRRTKGVEFVQVLDNSYEVQKWVDRYSSIRSTYDLDEISLTYDFYNGIGDEYKWKAGLLAAFTVSDDRYIFPASEMKHKNLYLGANGKMNLNAPRHNKWMFGADLVYKNNINGNYYYGGAAPDAIVISEFMMPDFEYLTQDYYKVGASVGYFTAIGQEKTTGLTLQLSADYYKPQKGDDHRLITSLGIGFTF